MGSRSRRELAQQAGSAGAGDRHRAVSGLRIYARWSGRACSHRPGGQPNHAARWSATGTASAIRNLRTRTDRRRLGRALLHHFRDVRRPRRADHRQRLSCDRTVAGRVARHDPALAALPIADGDRIGVFHRLRYHGAEREHAILRAGADSAGGIHPGFGLSFRLARTGRLRSDRDLRNVRHASGHRRAARFHASPLRRLLASV